MFDVLPSGPSRKLTDKNTDSPRHVYSLNIFVFFFHHSYNYADSERLIIHFKYILIVCY